MKNKTNNNLGKGDRFDDIPISRVCERVSKFNIRNITLGMITRRAWYAPSSPRILTSTIDAIYHCILQQS